MRLSFAAAVLAAVVLVMSAPPARADGTIKGQIVYGEKDVPAPKEINVDKDQAACLAKGKLYDQTWVIDKDTKGVRWVFVWLLDDKGNPLPAGAGAAAPEKKAKLDQPCCMFEPRVQALRKGQVLEVVNSASIAHNVNWAGGGAAQDNGNVILPAGGKHEITGFKPTKSAPVLISCNIHGWMKGYVRIFDHPYYAVTDKEGMFEIKGVPAGTWNMVVWHEGAGWGTGDSKGSKKQITVKNGDADAGKVEIVPAKD